VDTGQAHRLGPSHRPEHRRGRRLAARAPPAPGAGLPRLPGTQAPGARVHPGPAGGRLHPGAGDPLTQLPQRRLDPQVRARPTTTTDSSTSHRRRHDRC
jgi:hypothetical protein